MNGKVKLIAVAALEYRMAVFWFCLFSVNTLCSAIIVALEGKDWTTLKRSEQFIIVIAILMNWSGTIAAYISKASQKIKSGDIPESLVESEKSNETTRPT